MSLITTDIKVILFDLGGVLVELDGPPLRKEWLTEDISLAENWQRWVRCSAVVALESGKIDPQTFATQIIRELGLQVDVDEFIRAFTAWPKGLFLGVEALLSTLRADFCLACYSNTSAPHWQRLLGEMNLGAYLDHCFASFETGFYKPSLGGFEYISQKLGVPPEAILFLDDNLANVEAARAVGMRAEHTAGLAQVREALQNNHCL